MTILLFRNMGGNTKTKIIKGKIKCITLLLLLIFFFFSFSFRTWEKMTRKNNKMSNFMLGVCSLIILVYLWTLIESKYLCTVCRSFPFRLVQKIFFLNVHVLSYFLKVVCLSSKYLSLYVFSCVYTCFYSPILYITWFILCVYTVLYILLLQT